MNIEKFRDFCLGLPATEESTPFGEDTLVFKVCGKIFAITDIELFESINLKCDPDTAIELRERYYAVQPGYHMNKKHWNTISTQGDMPDTELRQWILHSYQLVVAGLPRTERDTIRAALSSGQVL